jgi:hypothetical protein
MKKNDKQEVGFDKQEVGFDKQEVGFRTSKSISNPPFRKASLTNIHMYV